LSQYIKEQDIPNLRVWTSWLKRTIQSASGIDAPQERWKALNEIDAVSYLFLKQVILVLLEKVHHFFIRGSARK